MADTPPTYDPNAGGHRGARPLAHKAGSYGAEPLGHAVSVGGFEYDEATLHSLAKDWIDLANEFQADRQYANNIAQAIGPGKEYASGGNAELVRASGDALVVTLDQRVDYCKAMAAKFLAALGKYATAEEAHVNEIDQTGGSL